MESKKRRSPDHGEDKQAAGANKVTEAARPRASTVRGLDPRSQEAIGKALKAHYDDLVRSPVPDKFMELLDRLEANEQSVKSQSGDDDSRQL